MSVFLKNIRKAFRWLSVWTEIFDSNGGGNSDFSFRQVIAAGDISSSGTRVKVTFTAPGSDSGLKIDNASIVERSADDDGTETPTELLFGGASGFTINTSESITSDPLQFALDSTKDYLVIVDMSNDGTRDDTAYVADGDGEYYKAATNSYDQQNVTGFTEQATITRNVSKIEAWS